MNVVKLGPEDFDSLQEAVDAVNEKEDLIALLLTELTAMKKVEAAAREVEEVDGYDYPMHFASAAMDQALKELDQVRALMKGTNDAQVSPSGADAGLGSVGG